MNEVETEGISQWLAVTAYSLRDELGERELSLRQRKTCMDTSPKWTSASLDNLTSVPVSDKKVLKFFQVDKHT